MGNSCGKSASVEFVGTPASERGGGGKDPRLTDDDNNNIQPVDVSQSQLRATAEESNNNTHQQCLEYVKAALDKQKVGESVVRNYSHSLLDIPGEELTFNFDHVVIAEDRDEVDAMVLPLEVGDDEEDEIDIDTRSTTWVRRRSKEFEYALPNDKYSKVTQEVLHLENTKKRKIVAMSDLHLGGSWSEGMDWKLEKYLDNLIQIAKEEVACFVMLGDIFEMWLEKFAEVPPDNAARVQAWKESASVLINAIDKLISECDVKVFYVRGNHDREITEQDVKTIFGEKVSFVPCTLILRLKTGSEAEHRVRLAHGHEWDVFNSYMLQDSNKLIPNRPIGYYIARAVSTAERHDSGSEVEDLLIGLAGGLLSMIPKALEDDLIDVLLRPEVHRKLIGRLFEGAFEVEDIDFLLQAKCRVSENEYVRLQSLLEYPLFRLCGSEVGKQDVFHMIKAATGDYKKFIRRSDEDVVVLAHTHRWDLRKYRNYKGNQVVYANTGCWTCNAEEFSSVVLDPPTVEKDGLVTIDYGKNE